VGDHPEAYTRFVSVSTYTRLDREAGDWRTAFTFVTDHSPGALYRAIEPFGRLRIDLHQLVSRPIPKTPWRYRFDAVLAGHPLDPIVKEALREMRERTRRLQVFGAYPARRDVDGECATPSWTACARRQRRRTPRFSSSSTGGSNSSARSVRTRTPAACPSSTRARRSACLHGCAS